MLHPHNWLLYYLIIGRFIHHAASTDDIGFAAGTLGFSTTNWNLEFLNSSGTLASLKPAGSDFDFLPYDFMLNGSRLENGSYHWGDVTIRYRLNPSATWVYQDSAARRKPVTRFPGNTLLSDSLTPTLPDSPLSIIREWIDISGDVGLRFTVSNNGNDTVELGGLGFPAAVNNIFTGRSPTETLNKCSLIDPYIGMDAGYLQVTPLSGLGPALVITPLGQTPLEGYRFLTETYHSATKIKTNSWEGFFEWMVHTKAWALNEWKNAEPWNEPTSISIAPGENRTYGLRFNLVESGIKDIDRSIRRAGMPTAISIPGYVVPNDLPATLHLTHISEVETMTAVPPNSLKITSLGDMKYSVEASHVSWGRSRLLIKYRDGKVQAVHYFLTKPASTAITDLGRHLTTEQWFDNQTDPFGRAPSIMGYDNEKGSIILQESRIKIAGLSDECGAGAYVTAAMKQLFLPTADEVTKLEIFANKTLPNVIADGSYAVKRSTFYYQPDLVPNFSYDPTFNWSKAKGRSYAFEIDRAYNYVWPAATYWALYRVSRSYPHLAQVNDWTWYLNQSYNTIMRGVQPDIGYWDAGLMGETVFGEVMEDLKRENWTNHVENMEESMYRRLQVWKTEPVPFGSEQSWDSTGQEGVYYWAR